jgi:hypothetical protein
MENAESHVDVCHRLDYLQEFVVGLQDNLTRVENLCAGFFNDFYQPNQHHPRVLDSYQAAARQYGCPPFTRLDGHTAAVVRWPDVPKPVVTRRTESVPLRLLGC